MPRGPIHPRLLLGQPQRAHQVRLQRVGRARDPPHHGEPPAAAAALAVVVDGELLGDGARDVVGERREGGGVGGGGGSRGRWGRRGGRGWGGCGGLGFAGIDGAGGKGLPVDRGGRGRGGSRILGERLSGVRGEMRERKMVPEGLAEGSMVAVGAASEERRREASPRL